MHPVAPTGVRASRALMIGLPLDTWVIGFVSLRMQRDAAQRSGNTHGELCAA
jgi:hypothetical protein